MSEHDNIEDDESHGVAYQPPKPVALSELLTKDCDDVALNKYKEKLIGTASNVILEPNDPRKVLMRRVTLLPEDHSEIAIDLSKIDKTNDMIIKLKEGSCYRVKLEFQVQRDIVSGLKYVQSVYKGPIRTDKTSYMLGSRAPKEELQSYISEKETVPSGMLARGKYSVKTQITDDDKNIYMKWEWTLEIAKDWK